MSTLSIGAKLMQYRIVEVLGAGGFGVTYLAKDEMLEKLFAIKEYFPEQFATRKGASVRAQASKSSDFQWGMQRFLDEARSLARFQHPNIVGVSQIFEANNTAYIVLEYQNGRSLKQWLSEFKDGPGQADLDKIVAPILNAIELIHRNNMLHRDLAPDNIYIREDGSPVILDFGSAREAIAARSRTISAIVKSGYSPAEQYSTRGSGQGPWSDVYGLAATLYLCVTGNAPEEATERLISDQYATAVDAAKAHYRKSFLEAIDWGLRLLPKHRPQLVDEWRIALLQDGGVSELSAGNKISSGKVPAAPGESDRHTFGVLLQRRNQVGVAFLVLAVALGFGLYKNKEKLSAILSSKSQVAELAKLDNRSVLTPNSQAALEIIKSLPSDELCRKALDGDRWSDVPILINHVAEAKRRGLTVETCKKGVNADSELIASPNSQAALEIIKSLPSDELCRKALDGDRWSTLRILDNHVAEAKRRGLTVETCAKAVNEGRQPVASPDNQAALGVTKGDAARLSKSEIDALRARLMSLWNPPVGARDADQFQVTIRIRFKRDGTLDIGPQVLTSGSGAQFNAIRDSAVRAVLIGQPYTMLRPDHYDVWKEIDFTFDTKGISALKKLPAGVPINVENERATTASSLSRHNEKPPAKTSRSKCFTFNGERFCD